MVQIDSVKQPIKRDSVGSGHVSHRRTSTFDDHLDHFFIVFENVKHGFKIKRFCVCDNVMTRCLIRHYLGCSVSSS